MPYEPKIIAYLCTWCSYTGADTAGIARLKSPANIRAIRVPCSGRVSPEIIMRTFDEGADGVLILGCHIGECHYESGNHRAAKRLPILHSLMAYAGLEPERLRLDWVSASEGERFSHIVTEFTEAVRSLGPAHWRFRTQEKSFKKHEPKLIPGILPTPDPRLNIPTTDARTAKIEQALHAQARELLSTNRVNVVIGYEVGPRGRTRPAFAYRPEDVQKLVWNHDCTHNLSTYLCQKFGNPIIGGKKKPVEPKPKAAVIVKPCDSRAINVMLSENRYDRDQVYIIGIPCDGIRQGAGFDARNSGPLQARCQACNDRTPVVYDTLIGEAVSTSASSPHLYKDAIDRLEALPPAERMEFWLSQFDRCIRCYACRQGCPMCDCPTCLYERDDSLWVGMGIGIDQKRAFHLGRAFHMAGRCVGCNECERACPMDIPISLLNYKLAQEIKTAFDHRAGMAVVPSPLGLPLAIVTTHGGEDGKR